MTDLEQLNREVAERVMGWIVKDYGGELIAFTGGTRKAIVLHPNGSGWSKQCELWSPATDIAAAFEVVDDVLAKYQHLAFDLFGEKGDWVARFFMPLDGRNEVTAGMKRCNSRTEAICHAALQVVNGER